LPFLFRGTVPRALASSNSSRLHPRLVLPASIPSFFFTLQSVGEHPTHLAAVMEPSLNQLRYPRASVSSVRVAAPTFPDMVPLHPLPQENAVLSHHLCFLLRRYRPSPIAPYLRTPAYLEMMQPHPLSLVYRLNMSRECHL
jgi:hypothetical protein